MKSKILVLSFLPVLVFFGLFTYGEPTENANFSERVKVALRDSGNKLLLANNDSISLILPIVELDKNTFELSFQNSLAVVPDSLIRIMDHVIKASNLPNSYIVEVIDPNSSEVHYSFEIKEAVEKNIIPCIGRRLPLGNYKIRVIFTHEQSVLAWNKGYSLLSLVAVGFLGLGLLYWKKENSGAPIKEAPQFSKIGGYQFYKNQNKLTKDNTTIAFTAKECELFSIFAENPNQIIKRDLLVKKVWEDHGIFVGRSLDTFISRLRKKFEDDNSINIITVHGVGYKLETS